jgi:hypothetical protein
MHNHFVRLTTAFAALISFGAAPLVVQASPLSDISQAWRTFGTVKSFHAEIKMPNNRTILLDEIVPDKMHVTLPQGMQMIRINSDQWIYRDGSWMKIPMAMPQAGAIAESAQGMGIKGKPDADSYSITYLGTALVNGASTQHYRIARKDNSTKPTEMWIGANHLPVQVMTHTDDGPMTIVYSNYDAIPNITAPI